MPEAVDRGHDEAALERDVLVIGAGPIGVELGVCLSRAGLSYAILEARQMGHSIGWWPRNTPFFSTTERLDIAGVPMQNNHQGRITGEDYLAYLRSVVEQFDLELRPYEPVVGIERLEEAPESSGRRSDEASATAGFRLTTEPICGGRRVWRSRYLVLATGDMHQPRRLEIPGEDLPHVSHYFHDPHDYFRTRLLVVGGKNSAVEAALRSWRAGARVSLSYRQAEFDRKRVKPHLMPDLDAQIEAGNIGFHPATVPVAIRPGEVDLQPTQDAVPIAEGAIETVAADFVLLATGFEADPALPRMAGITLIGPQRAPVHDPETMETNVPGLYVAGTAIAGTQARFRVFIETSHVHVGRILQHLTGTWPEALGTVPQRRYELPFEHYQAN